jgi:hypothetical protein
VPDVVVSISTPALRVGVGNPDGPDLDPCLARRFGGLV